MDFKNAPILAGTAGGTLASLLPNIGVEQLLTTCILAIVGATVSFVITLLLKKLFKLLDILITCHIYRKPKMKDRN
ncbi:hypothetical protein Aeqsu_3074 [Aequorivita sublithincola DSM 14238]|uniref:Uncharacterized protein n=1 Tax=Aequorivita sublithincola (strain DSM 14238 / LMG 21431 / ACAM 643 / 9-3) TaxID=746697 RepID=I3YZU3_AEQSU|nr:hypothetical protein [Aequorivita sublithincola]AFL82511.1 hypothetical protein Aeqsu_3074 [Aequorivita sublithincola DSM 14238]